MEIEVKLKYTNREAVVDWLKANGFVFTKFKEIRDSYFGTGADTMTNIQSLYRLREVFGEFKELTLKDGKRDNAGVWTRRELNVSIDNPENMKEILFSLGCKLIKENFSVREIWNKDKTVFAFIGFSKPVELHIAEIEGPNEADVQKLIDLLGDKVEVAGEEVFTIFDKIQTQDENK
ncbi:hypothetical protein A3K29_03905 [Candidatus Collierbacteria bacterium RIFOXYB2_FULL_46_14]|uniref:CYTH domain-containing protein n=1 Tax=Candidatus Collierbacteria bacterium GW2011_GWA2_46_26 TaxID=1618381 RepID=A0A0G1PIT6_9BACT|nr:MAG: hypothetical protein UW29_C0007G0017 [Candidatus Collierbacteria bacterium GW2011_GWC2_44_13]KKU32666.1 MAG: hypothetical protein UX47_C0008G0023 [Candidatus Collierbacteria bacterium GW2011_GWA2_46_26]OGD73257.1 MAG: hypothetical protein A3K29_03905 [Candidatus Collierbacteria bacterium RIFOXYB2_FULL_46_14]OGD76299.1 MAG: hypothetical protein A3K43_03905 [Candidatus Collierbacteria bacterium RIFOXYA2_FULL_46_20]OGD77635.1 MAG: hypothetical protein A3K39_03905 [Candidatus Collierbacteri